MNLGASLLMAAAISYVANYGNNTIEEFNSSGTGAIFANTGLDEPIGLAFDSSGNLYVANAANSTIEEFSADQPVFSPPSSLTR